MLIATWVVGLLATVFFTRNTIKVQAGASRGFTWVATVAFFAFAVVGGPWALVTAVAGAWLLAPTYRSLRGNGLGVVLNLLAGAVALALAVSGGFFAALLATVLLVVAGRHTFSASIK